MEANYTCSKCPQKFSVKSNLSRHMKVHEPRSLECTVCKKTFTLQQTLDRHKKIHLYPVIPLFNQNEALLKCFSQAKRVASQQSQTIEQIWFEEETAQKAAKMTGQDMWRSNLIITFGKYAGQSYKWLLENDVGWAVNPSSTQEESPSTSSVDEPSSSDIGCHKSWEDPPLHTQAMYEPNIRWLKTDPNYGLFKKDASQKKILRNKMDFPPPPLPTGVQGTLPSMLMFFFTTPAFFGRPVGVMALKIRCPNADCPAPPGSFLTRSGYGNVARTVCSLNYNYTLLTERLMCFGFTLPRSPFCAS